MGIFRKRSAGKNLRKLFGDGHSDYKAHSESQPSASLSVDFLRVMQILTLWTRELPLLYARNSSFVYY